MVLASKFLYSVFLKNYLKDVKFLCSSKSIKSSCDVGHVLLETHIIHKDVGIQQK